MEKNLEWKFFHFWAIKHSQFFQTGEISASVWYHIRSDKGNKNGEKYQTILISIESQPKKVVVVVVVVVIVLSSVVIVIIVVVVVVPPRNLTLKFRRNQVSKSWDIAEFAVLVGGEQKN